MVFNGLLITFDIRNIIQWASLFIRTPVKKLQPIVSSILGHVYSIVAMPNACVIVKINNISSWQKRDYRCFLAQLYFFYLFINLVHFWTNQKPAFSIYGINSDIFSISWLTMNFWMLNLSKYIGHHRVYEALLKFVLCLKLMTMTMKRILLNIKTVYSFHNI